MKKWLFLVYTIASLSSAVQAQSLTSPNCGVDSAFALATILGVEVDDQAKERLDSRYQSPEVSLLDIKAMCASIGVKTEGTQSSFSGLLANQTPCIICLKDPGHFLVLLDGDEKEVRVLDGESAALKVLPRRDVEEHFTGFALVPQSHAVSGGPSVKFARLDRYIEFQGLGQDVDFHFPFKNRGRAPLIVAVDGTSCGCTAAVLGGDAKKRTVLLPDADSEVKITFHVGTLGAVQQMATLKTNDPRHRVIYLSIRGQLPTQLTLSPPGLYIEQNMGEGPEKGFRVLGPAGTRVERVWSNLPFLQFKIGPQENDTAGTRCAIAVSGFGQAPVGKMDGKIWLQLSGSKTLFLPVRGHVDDPSAPGENEAAALPRAEDDPNSEIALPLPTVTVGQVTPDFVAQDAEGQLLKLSNWKGKKNVLLTFFPKCFTGGCANHLSSLRDHQAEFDAADTQILAVSVDPADGERGQIAFADKWKLKFPLIPDEQRVLCKLFGAAQANNQRAARMSVLIDKSGKVRWIDTDVHVLTHGADVLEKINELGLQ